MVKIYVQTPLKFWFHIKFSREYDYVNEYPYSAKLQNMTCWTESGTQSSHIKGLDKCVWCWVCSVLSKQRGEVVWWGGGVRFTKANCGQESQWPYTDCGPAVTGMFASWNSELFSERIVLYMHFLSFLDIPSPQRISNSRFVQKLGLYSLRRRRLKGIEIPIINLRRSDDRLRFIMGIPVLIRRRHLSE